MTPPSETSRACVFRVGEHRFAVDADRVAEVMHTAALTPVPLAPGAIAGLLHLRGRIVPAIDVRLPLGLAAAEADAARTNLVIHVADDWYSLLVDEVLDVQSIPADAIERPTGHTDPSAAFRTGVFADASCLVHLLDPERLVQTIHRQRTDPFARHGVSNGG